MITALAIFFLILIVGLLLFTGQSHVVVDGWNKASAICQSGPCKGNGIVNIPDANALAVLIALVVASVLVAILIHKWVNYRRIYGVSPLKPIKHDDQAHELEVMKERQARAAYDYNMRQLKDAGYTSE